MANNRIVHFEIPANQPEALTKFYGELFGGNICGLWEQAAQSPK